MIEVRLYQVIGDTGSYIQFNYQSNRKQFSTAHYTRAYLAQQIICQTTVFHVRYYEENKRLIQPLLVVRWTESLIATWKKTTKRNGTQKLTRGTTSNNITDVTRQCVRFLWAKFNMVQTNSSINFFFNGGSDWSKTLSFSARADVIP